MHSKKDTSADPSELKIGFLNFQSGANITRGYYQYFLKSWKLLFAHSQKPLPKLADFIQKENFDIFLLSEIDGGSRRTKNINQIKYLSENTHLAHHEFFPTYKVFSRINQGNAICSRWPIIKSRNIKLPGEGQSRYFAVSEITLPSKKTIRFCVTHLSLSASIRKEQTKVINRHIKYGRDPVILGGDFNFRKENEIELMAETAFNQIIVHPTFPSWRPKYFLDHFFASDHFEILNSDAIKRPKFSDHLLITANLKLKDND